MREEIEDVILVDQIQEQIDGQIGDIEAGVEDQEKAFSEGYKKAYEDLTQNRGFSPRKARRYLDSIAKKKVRKFLKGQK
jgi:hypothetical protein